jgi:hypothetical protein
MLGLTAGKTLVAIRRALLEQEQIKEEAAAAAAARGEELDGDAPALRQVFLTTSRYLSSSLEREYKRLERSEAISKDHEAKEGQEEDVPRKREGEEAQQDEEEGEEGGEVLRLEDLDRMDNQSGADGAPPTPFHQVEEKDFPAFFAYQHLLEKLDAALLKPFLSSAKEERYKQMALRFVSGRTFIEKYWPHLDQTLRKSLAPAKVWTQICTHIKGSFASAKRGQALEQGEYLLLVLRKRRQEEEAEVKGDEGCSKERRDATSTAVSEDEAVQTYALFKNYEQLKARNGEWDQCDLVLHVHAGLAKGAVSGEEWPRVDRIYVDEVSDTG